jgi:hypothetical protein
MGCSIQEGGLPRHRQLGRGVLRGAYCKSASAYPSTFVSINNDYNNERKNGKAFVERTAPLAVLKLGLTAAKQVASVEKHQSSKFLFPALISSKRCGIDITSQTVHEFEVGRPDVRQRAEVEFVELVRCVCLSRSVASSVASR